MRVVTDLPDGYWNKDVLDLLNHLERACEMLDTLAQIQACAGGLSMTGRAHDTDVVCAHLKNVLPVLRKAADEDSKRMREKRK